MVVFLAFAVGLVAGGVGLWLWARGEIRAYRARLTAADEKLALVEKTQGQWDDQLRALTGNALAQSSTSLLELAKADYADEDFRPLRCAVAGPRAEAPPQSPGSTSI